MSELLLLTDEELAHLTDAELAAYESAITAETESWELQPKQKRAEDLTLTCNDVAYGGAAGGGKSDWGLRHVYELSKKYPKHRSLVLRTVLPELRRSLIARSLEKFDAKECRYRPGEKEWRFTNGSVIEFGYLETDDDVYQYKSAEYDCIFFDEVTELSEFQYDYLKSRCRTTVWKRKLGIRPHTICATNPGGKGHAWFKKRYVSGTNHGEDIVETEYKDPMTGAFLGTRKIAFVPATLLDNAFIDPEYKLNLMALPYVEMRQLLYGDWDVFAGQFFSDWAYDVHVVRPFTLPKEWVRFRAIDYGYAAPMCCGWFAIDWDHNLYLYRELYERRLTATEQALEIRRRSLWVEEDGEQRPERIGYTVADPSIWTTQGDGTSIARQYNDAGLLCRKAMNARIDGWSVVRQYLKPNEQGEARLRVFPTAENLIRTLPDLIHDRDNPEDVHQGTDVEDHAADMLRYACMSRARAPRRERKEEMTEIQRDLRQYERRRRNVHPVLGRID